MAIIWNNLSEGDIPDFFFMYSSFSEHIYSTTSEIFSTLITQMSEKIAAIDQ